MKLKYILSLTVTLTILFFTGVFYYAYQKINGEELRKFMIASLEDVFPHATVDVGEVKLKLGSSLNLTVEGLTLTLSKEQKLPQDNLFKIQKMGMEIPLLSVLGFEQNITVHLDDSHINFTRAKGISNWMEAFQKNTSKKSTSTSSVRTATAPAFLANGKFNLKFTDTLLSYNMENAQKGEMMVEYFRVDNLGLKSNAAYELKLDISLNFSQQIMDIGLSLIGQFSPTEFVQEGTLKTTSILMVNKMHFPSQNISIPGFKTDLKLELSNTGDITAKLATTLNDKNRIDAVLKTRNKELSVEDIDLVFYLNELMDILNMDVPSLRVGDGRIELKGNMLLGSQFRPNVTFQIGPQIKYSYQDKIFVGELKGKYQQQSLVIGMSSKGLGGSLYGDFFIDNMNIGKQPIVLSQLPPFKLLIMANDLAVPQEMIQAIFYADSDKQLKPKQKVVLLPRGTVDFNLKNISLGGNPLSLTGGITVDKRQLTSKEIKLLTSDGEGSATFKSRLYREGVKSQISAKLNNLNLKDISIFYPKGMGVLEGMSSGNMQGTIGNLNEKTNYNIKFQFQIQNGHWHGIDLSQYTQNIVDGLSLVPVLGDKLKGKKLTVSNKFKEASLNVQLTHEQWHIKRYSLVSESLSLKGSKGILHPPPTKKKSTLPMEMDLKEIRPILLKNFTRQSLPLLLSGTGFALKPDVSFVTRKLVRSHIKKRSQKTIQKLKDKVLEKSNKGNKIEGLIKGLL